MFNMRRHLHSIWHPASAVASAGSVVLDLSRDRFPERDRGY